MQKCKKKMQKGDFLASCAGWGVGLYSASHIWRVKKLEKVCSDLSPAEWWSSAPKDVGWGKL